MKDIKSYVIGFLTCACLFLIMGHSGSLEGLDLSGTDKNRYVYNMTPEGRQPFSMYQAVEHDGLLYILNTMTAELYWRNPKYGENSGIIKPTWVKTETEIHNPSTSSNSSVTNEKETRRAKYITPVKNLTEEEYRNSIKD